MRTEEKIMISTKRLMLYKDFAYNDIFYGIADIIDAVLSNEENAYEDMAEKAYTCVNQLIEVTDNYGLEGNLYHSFLTFLLVNNENAFSMSCEKIGDREGSINNIAKNDLEIFKGLFDVDLYKLDEVLGTVAKENYDDMKRLYDKIVDYYKFVLHICHIDLDWYNGNIITVKKENNISSLK